MIAPTTPNPFCDPIIFDPIPAVLDVVGLAVVVPLVVVTLVIFPVPELDDTLDVDNVAVLETRLSLAVFVVSSPSTIGDSDPANKASATTISAAKLANNPSAREGVALIAEAT